MGVFYSCKKYPQDDPSLRLRTVSNRIHGTYVLEKYIVNDIDSTNLIPPCVAFNSLDYGVADGKYYYYFDEFGNVKGMDGSGFYTLINKKNDFSVSYGVGNNIMQHTLAGESCVRKILKLDGKNFWLKQELGNLIYELHLKKIHKI